MSDRKDDRATRPIYRCPEKFRESWLANGYFSRNLLPYATSLHLCVWSNPIPATNVRQACCPL